MLYEYLNKLIPISIERRESINSLISSSKQKKAGEYLVNQDEICNKLFFLKKGITKMIYEKDNKTFIKDFVFENNFVSVYESFINRKPARYSLKAVTDCEYDVIQYQDLQKAYNEVPALKELQLIMTEHIYLNVSNRLESLITLSAEERYLELIKIRPNLVNEIPQFMLASYLGITDVALSRIRGRIAKKR